MLYSLLICSSYTIASKRAAAAAAAKLLQSCPTLCNPIDGSPSGSPIPGILQARTLKWVAISFSNAWKWKVKVKSLIRTRLLATPWTAAYQAPPSMGFSRQEYWSGLPLPSPIKAWVSVKFVCEIYLGGWPVLEDDTKIQNTINWSNIWKFRIRLDGWKLSVVKTKWRHFWTTGSRS